LQHQTIMSKHTSLDWNSNPERLVKLEGSLTQGVGRTLAIKIEKLQTKSPEPITICINSRGGEVKAFHELDRVFKKSNIHGKGNHIVTVASNAASAAACLLVAGHFAYVLKNARIGFHGAIWSCPQDGKTLRRDQVLAVGLRMDRNNRKIAKAMARRVAYRVAAIGTRLKEQAKITRKEISPKRFFEKYIDCVKIQLSSDKPKALLAESFNRYNMLFSLIRHFPTKKLSFRRKDFSALEAKVFKAIITYEVKTRLAESRTINPTMATEIIMDYILAREFIRDRHLNLIEDLAKARGEIFLTRHQAAKYRELASKTPAKASAYLITMTRQYTFGLWCFSLTFCHHLLSGQLTLSANDAYWLGLVDEVLE